MAPVARGAGRREVTEIFDDDDNGNGGEEEQALENCPITLKEAGLGAGASICFFRAGCGGQGRASVGRTYVDIAEELVRRMRELLQGRGPLGRVHLLKVIVTDATALAATVALLLVVYWFHYFVWYFCFFWRTRTELALPTFDLRCFRPDAHLQQASFTV